MPGEAESGIQLLSHFPPANNETSFAHCCTNHLYHRHFLSPQTSFWHRRVVGMGLLPALDDAARRLLTPDAVVVPHSVQASIYLCGVLPFS